MNITKPCVYHYLFSNIPDYGSSEEAKKIAENLVFRLKRDLGLKEDESQRLRQLSADVTLLSFHADEETETYLSQLLSHDLIATILTYNQTEAHEESLAFLERKRNARFPGTSNRIGETSVFFVQAAPNTELVKQIAHISGETQVTEPFPCCQFEWSALYALQHFAQSRHAQQKAMYVLLVPQEENLKKGDHFLSHLFPILESIRYKLVFEEQEARKFKANNLRHEQEITRLLDKINRTLSDATQRSSFEDDLRQVDTHQAALYQSIAETDALLLTLRINQINFKNTLAALASVDDILFAPLLPEFRFIRQQIEYDLKYIKFLLPGLDKREELLRLKIDWQRKAAEERSNKIREITNALIFAFGVAIGAGQLLADVNLPLFQNFSPDQELLLKLGIMVFSGGVTFLLSRYTGLHSIKSFLEGKGWSKNIGENIRGEQEKK